MLLKRITFALYFVPALLLSIALDARPRLPIQIFNPGRISSEIVEELPGGFRHRISFEKSPYVIDAHIQRFIHQTLSESEEPLSTLAVNLRVENARRGLGPNNLAFDEGYLNAIMRSDKGPYIGTDYLHIGMANSIPAGVPGYQGPMAGQHMYAALRHLYPHHPFLGKVESTQIRKGLIAGLKRSPFENNFTHSTLSGAPGPIRFLRFEESTLSYRLMKPVEVVTSRSVGLLRLPGSADEPIRWLDRSRTIRENPAGYLKGVLRAHMR
jgi:hypothetical protein